MAKALPQVADSSQVDILSLRDVASSSLSGQSSAGASVHDSSTGWPIDCQSSLDLGAEEAAEPLLYGTNSADSEWQDTCREVAGRMSSPPLAKSQTRPVHFGADDFPAPLSTEMACKEASVEEDIKDPTSVEREAAEGEEWNENGVEGQEQQPRMTTTTRPMLATSWPQTTQSKSSCSVAPPVGMATGQADGSDVNREMGSRMARRPVEMSDFGLDLSSESLKPGDFADGQLGSGSGVFDPTGQPSS
ncbi:unnamed protein product, partial [Protopolystoma xenopodis]